MGIKLKAGFFSQSLIRFIERLLPPTQTPGVSTFRLKLNDRPSSLFECRVYFVCFVKTTFPTTTFASLISASKNVKSWRNHSRWTDTVKVHHFSSRSCDLTSFGSWKKWIFPPHPKAQSISKNGRTSVLPNLLALALFAGWPLDYLNRRGDGLRQVPK